MFYNLQLIADYQHWHGDGTFKISLEIYYQLFTGHAQCGQIFPRALALLINKQEFNVQPSFSLVIGTSSNKKL